MNNYLRATEYLKKLFAGFIFDDKAQNVEEKKIVHKFVTILNKRLHLKKCASTTSLKRFVHNNWGQSHIPPSDLKIPLELFLEFLVEDNPYLKNIPDKTFKQAAEYIISDTVILERLFVTSGLTCTYIISKFDLKMKAPSVIQSIDEKKKKRFRYLLLSVMQRGVLLSGALFFIFKNTYAKAVRTYKRMGNFGKGSAVLSAGIITAATIYLLSGPSDPSVTGTIVNGQVGRSNGIYFSWEIKKDMSLNVVKAGKVRIFADGRLFSQKSEYNLANFICMDKSGNNAAFEGIFKTFSDAGGSQALKLESVRKSKFIIQKNGQYRMSSKEKLPNVRSIPSFPKMALAPGMRWSSPFQINYYDLEPSFLVHGRAQYIYLSNIIKRGKKYAKIKIDYAYRENIRNKYSTTSPESISIIYGTNSSILYWDIKNNKPRRLEETFDETIVKNSGATIRHSMNFHSTYDITTPIKKSEMEDIKKDCDTRLSSDNHITTAVRKDGIHIVLGDIYFSFDDYFINEQCKSVLNKIKPVLKKYKHYEIAVEGHTDNTGDITDNLKLSDIRARSVGNYLVLNIDGIKNKLYTRGYGANRPMFDNSAIDGRQRNRRVEIIIKQIGK